MRSIDEYQGGTIVSYALRILPYLALRSAELRGGRWSEIDLDKELWIIPASRREKAKDGGGMKMRIAHEVSLPTQVVKLFRELHLLTGKGSLCFPGRHSSLQCISDMVLLNGIRRMGFSKEEMTIHGFCAMFSIFLNEKKLEWGFDADIVRRTKNTLGQSQRSICVDGATNRKPCGCTLAAACFALGTVARSLRQVLAQHCY